MLVNYRVVVEIKANRDTIVPTRIALSGVLPPLVKCAMVVGAEDLIVEPQTEARTAESVGPNLCVLAMAAHLTVVPLLGQMRCHTRVIPDEGVRAIPDHLERLIPLVVVRHVSVQAHQ